MKQESEKAQQKGLSMTVTLSLGVIGFVTIAIVMILYFWVFGLSGSFEKDQQLWAMFGDYVGGVTNPIIALLALLGLLITIQMQRRDFKETTDSLKEQVELAKIERLENSLSALAPIILAQVERITEQEVQLLRPLEDEGWVAGIGGLQDVGLPISVPVSALVRDSKAIVSSGDYSNAFNALRRSYLIDAGGTLQQEPFQDLLTIINRAGRILDKFPQEYRSSSMPFIYLVEELRVYNRLFRELNADVHSVFTEQSL